MLLRCIPDPYFDFGAAPHPLLYGESSSAPLTHRNEDIHHRGRKRDGTRKEAEENQEPPLSTSEESPRLGGPGRALVSAMACPCTTLGRRR